MTQEIAVVDQVTVDVDGISDLGEYAAIPAPASMEVVLQNTSSGNRRLFDVHGFTASGHPLVVQRDRLAPVRDVRKPDESAVLVSSMPEQPVGPFTPAPDGMAIEFTDGSWSTVAYYDVHGRACAIDSVTTGRSLYLVEDHPGIKHIYETAS